MVTASKDRAGWDKNVSPVGWYIGSYQLRFVELARDDVDDDEAQFHVWENTVLVKAHSLDAAFNRITEIGLEETQPYKGGPDGVDVQWQFEGVTELFPVYEEIGDGCEVMWNEHPRRRLSDIRSRARSKEECRQ